MNAPIVFCHYGDDQYLRQSLTLAKASNPNKDIVLIGDEFNKKYSDIGITHKFYCDYKNEKILKEFDNVYAPVIGRDHGREEWVKFVFKRYFYIQSYVNEVGADCFWTFDSDVFIVDDIEHWESKLKNFDCTEQADGNLMSGFVNGKKIISDYLWTIIELFSDTEYINMIKNYLHRHPDHAFTEMAAFVAHKYRRKLKTHHLRKIVNGEMFDDAICNEHDFDYSEGSKKVFPSHGSFFLKFIPTCEFVKVCAINTSWTDSIFRGKLYDMYFSGEGRLSSENFIVFSPKISKKYMIARKIYKLGLRLVK